MKKLSLLLTLIAVTIFAVGCDTDSTIEPGTVPNTNGGDDGHGHEHGEGDDHSDHDHAAHDHTPPHGGHLIELGHNHEYHAELVDNHDTDTFTIYMLDSHLEPLTLPAAAINLVLTAGEKTETYVLEGNKPDGSSEYSSKDGKLMAMIDSGEVKGKLRVTIEGKPYSGAFDHHPHAHGDDHKHGDGHAHDDDHAHDDGHKHEDGHAHEDGEKHEDGHKHDADHDHADDHKHDDDK